MLENLFDSLFRGECAACLQNGVDYCQVHSIKIREAMQRAVIQQAAWAINKPMTGVTIEGEYEVVTEKKALPELKEK